MTSRISIITFAALIGMSISMTAEAFSFGSGSSNPRAGERGMRQMPAFNRRNYSGIRLEKGMDEKGYYLTVHIGGMAPEDLLIRPLNGSLMISSSQMSQTETRDQVPGRSYRFSRSFGSFNRRVSLPFDADIEKPDRRHLMFPALVAILDCVFVFIPHETQVRFIRPFESTGLHANPMMMMSVLVILVYLGSVAMHLYRLRFKYELRYNGLAYSIIIGSIFAVVASCIGYFAGLRLLFHLACTSLSIVIALTLLYSIHYPDFFQTLQKEMEKKRYDDY